MLIRLCVSVLLVFYNRDIVLKTLPKYKYRSIHTNCYHSSISNPTVLFYYYYWCCCYCLFDFHIVAEVVKYPSANTSLINALIAQDNHKSGLNMRAPKFISASSSESTITTTTARKKQITTHLWLHPNIDQRWNQANTKSTHATQSVENETQTVTKHRQTMNLFTYKLSTTAKTNNKSVPWMRRTKWNYTKRWISLKIFIKTGLLDALARNK